MNPYFRTSVDVVFEDLHEQEGPEYEESMRYLLGKLFQERRGRRALEALPEDDRVSWH